MPLLFLTIERKQLFWGYWNIIFQKGDKKEEVVSSPVYHLFH